MSATDHPTHPRKSIWRKPRTWIIGLPAAIAGGSLVWWFAQGFYSGSQTPAIKNPLQVAEREVQKGPHVWERDLTATQSGPWWTIPVQIGRGSSPYEYSLGVLADDEIALGLIAVQKYPRVTQAQAIKAAVDYYKPQESARTYLGPAGIIRALSSDINPSTRLSWYPFIANNLDDRSVLDIARNVALAGKTGGLESLIGRIVYSRNTDLSRIQEARDLLFQLAPCNPEPLGRLLVAAARNAVAVGGGQPSDEDALARAQELYHAPSCRVSVRVIPEPIAAGITPAGLVLAV